MTDPWYVWLGRVPLAALFMCFQFFIFFLWPLFLVMGFFIFIATDDLDKLIEGLSPKDEFSLLWLGWTTVKEVWNGEI